MFLIGIGLSLEEAMIFWRKSFSKLSDEEYEKKGYNYNIRYNYGMEGKRTNYTPYSCSNIISTVAGSGEVCGCPFKTLPAEPLGSLLQNMKLDPINVGEVVTKAKSGHFQLACTRFFELTRGKSLHQGGIIDSDKKFLLPEPINHPNRYFDYSFKGIAKEDTK